MQASKSGVLVVTPELDCPLTLPGVEYPPLPLQFMVLPKTLQVVEPPPL